MPYSNGLDQPRAPARAPAHFCTICSRTAAILDGLCAKCWRTQRIDPLRKEENNLNNALLTLRTAIVQHEARLFHEQEIARESQLSERFYCPYPSCKRLEFQFQSEMHKHIAEHAVQLKERSAQAHRPTSVTTPRLRRSKEIL